MKPGRITGRRLILTSFMKLLSLMSSGVFLIMNIATAAPEQLVSYHATRVNGLEIFYREAGPKDALTILLLHGLPSSSRMYQSLLESSLSEKYHLIAPDYPGFGHSSWPNPKEFAYTFDSLAKVMQN
jgi:alpha-beta hydrolase superfamily lysophospholipase